jgi:hypothetical protein
MRWFVAVAALVPTTLIAACSSGTGTPDIPSGSTSSGTSHGQSGSFTSFVGGPGSGSCVPGAPATFADAICVCQGLAMAGALRTHAPTGASASVGVDEGARMATGTSIEGAFVPYASLDVAGGLDVRDALATTGNLAGAGSLNVGGDLSVGAQLLFAGDLQVGGALRLASPGVTVPGLTSSSTAPYVAPSGPPCGCDAASLLPISQGFAAAKASNDDAAHGLSPDGADLLGSGTITLTTGTYYFAGIDRVGAGKIVIDGAVAIYFDGSTISVGSDRIQLLPGASLDMYVSGLLATAGSVVLGDPSNPQSFRLFVGGAGSMMVTAGAQTYYGLVYAPQADVVFAGVTQVDGSVFAKSLTWAGVLDVTYAGPSSSTTTCPPSPSPSSPSAPPGSGPSQPIQ